MSPGVALIIGLVLALGGSIAMYVLVMPKKKDGQLPPFLQFLHDYFHFKQLYVEVATKFLFMLNSLLCVFGGFFMLFSSPLAGFALMLLGPVVMRLIYELSMMFILLVQNVIDINKKMNGGSAPSAAPASYRPAQPAQNARPTTWFCPNCGTRVDDGQPFCPNCGTRNSSR